MEPAALPVLVVDDDPVVARVHATAVACVAGLRLVGIAHRAGEIREMVDTRNVDLLLLDVHLPDGDGLVIVEAFGQRPRDGPDVFVITAARDMPTIRRAQRAGVLQYLIKPFRSRSLSSVLSATAMRTTRAEVLDLHSGPYPIPPHRVSAAERP